MRRRRQRQHKQNDNFCLLQFHKKNKKRIKRQQVPKAAVLHKKSLKQTDASLSCWNSRDRNVTNQDAGQCWSVLRWCGMLHPSYHRRRVHDMSCVREWKTYMARTEPLKNSWLNRTQKTLLLLQEPSPEPTEKLIQHSALVLRLRPWDKQAMLPLAAH